MAEYERQALEERSQGVGEFESFRQRLIHLPACSNPANLTVLVPVSTTAIMSLI